MTHTIKRWQRYVIFMLIFSQFFLPLYRVGWIISLVSAQASPPPATEYEAPASLSVEQAQTNPSNGSNPPTIAQIEATPPPLQTIASWNYATTKHDVTLSSSTQSFDNQESLFGENDDQAAVMTAGEHDFWYDINSNVCVVLTFGGKIQTPDGINTYKVRVRQEDQTPNNAVGTTYQISTSDKLLNCDDTEWEPVPTGNIANLDEIIYVFSWNTWKPEEGVYRDPEMPFAGGISGRTVRSLRLILDINSYRTTGGGFTDNSGGKIFVDSVAVKGTFTPEPADSALAGDAKCDACLNANTAEQSQPKVGEPLSVMNGHYSYSVHDMSLFAGGNWLDFRRFYSDASGEVPNTVYWWERELGVLADGPGKWAETPGLPAGWHHNYDIRLIPGKCYGSYTYALPNTYADFVFKSSSGSYHCFRQSDGNEDEFIAEAGFLASMKRVQVDTVQGVPVYHYIMILTDQTRYLFDQKGLVYQIDKVADTNGNGLAGDIGDAWNPITLEWEVYYNYETPESTIAYTSNDVVWSGNRLKKISSGGRYLELVYDNDLRGGSRFSGGLLVELHDQRRATDPNSPSVTYDYFYDPIDREAWNELDGIWLLTGASALKPPSATVYTKWEYEYFSFPAPNDETDYTSHITRVSRLNEDGTRDVIEEQTYILPEGINLVWEDFVTDVNPDATYEPLIAADFIGVPSSLVIDQSRGRGLPSDPGYKRERIIQLDIERRNGTAYVLDGNGNEIQYTFNNKTIYEIRYLNEPDETLPPGTTSDDVIVKVGHNGPNFRPGAQMDGEGNVTAMSWTADGHNLTKVTDASGATTDMEYGFFNRLEKVTDARNHVTDYDYDNPIYPTLPTLIKDATLHETALEYDAAGNLIKLTAKNDLTTTADDVSTCFTYDAHRQRASMVLNCVTTVTNPATQNLTTSFVYDDVGRLVRTTDPLGRITVMVYDVRGDVVRTIENYTGSNFTPSVLLTVTHNLTSPTTNLVTSISYDSAGNVIKVTDTTNRETRYSYDFAGRVTQVIINYVDGVFSTSQPDQDLKTLYDYDANGNVIEVIDPTNRIFTQCYNSQNQLVRQIVNRRDWTAGNACMHVRETNNPDQNLVTDYAYDKAGNVIEVIDPAGIKTNYIYDSLNRVAAVVYNNAIDEGDLGPQDESHTLTDAVDEDLIQLTYYDKVGNIDRTVDAAGRVTQYCYDQLNRPIRQIVNFAWANPDANFAPTSGVAPCIPLYDLPDPQLPPLPPFDLSADPAKDLITNYVYDQAGRLSMMIDPQDRFTKYEYDALGRVTREITNYFDGVFSAAEPDKDLITAYTYDASGNVISVVEHPEGGSLRRETVLCYDARNQLTKRILNVTVGNACSLTSSGSATENIVVTVAYDSLGQVVQQIDPNNAVTDFQYDAVGRMTATVIYPDNAPPIQMTTTYDVQGNVLAVTDPVGQTTLFQYDALGRPVLVTTPEQIQAQTTYDIRGRAIRQIQGFNSATPIRTDYSYNDLNQVVIVTENVNPNVAQVNDPAQPSQNVQTLYTYNNMGGLKNVILPNYASITYQYDALNRPIDVDGALTGTSDTWRMTYDRAGRQVTQTDPLNQTQNYAYDLANRLTSVTHQNPVTPTATVTYQYDARGRRTSMVDNSGALPTSYGYDALDRVTTLNDSLGRTVQYGYDAASRRTSLTTTVATNSQTVNYQYDALNRLTTVTDWDAATNNVTYTYDDANRVTGMTLPNGVQAAYTYDDDGRLTRVAYTDANGNPLMSYDYTLDVFGNRVAARELVAPPNVLLPGYYEETETRLAYSGTWTSQSNASASDGQYRSTTATGAEVRFQFVGEELILFRSTQTTYGSLEVCVDGSCQTVTNPGSNEWQVPFAVRDLDEDVHSVVIRSLSGSGINLDAVQILNELPALLPGSYEEDEPALLFAGAWLDDTDYVHTLSSGAFLEFRFTGTGFALDRRLNANWDMTVCVDGTCQAVSNDSGQHWETFYVQGLAQGTHTVTVNANVGDPLYVDRVQVFDTTSTAPLTLGTYDADAAGLIYSGSWWEDTNAPGDVYREASTANAASLTFTFSGTGFELWRWDEPSYATVNLCVDSVCESVPTGGNYSWQPIIRGGYAPGTHTVTMTVPPDVLSDVDKIVIRDLSQSTPLTAGKHQETVTGIRYDSAWWNGTDQRGETFKGNLDAQGGVEFRFTGTGFAIKRMTDADWSMQVCIDYTCETVSSDFDADMHWMNDYVHDLAAGTHSVRITPIGDSELYLAYVEVFAGTEFTALPVGENDRFDSRLKLEGNWSKMPDNTPPYLYSSDPDATLKFQFTGTGFGITRLVGAGYGSLDVCVDGGTCQTVSHNSGDITAWFNGYTSGTHSVEIRLPNNSYFDLDSIDVVDNTSSGPTFYRGINFGGSAIAIDGNSWESGTTAPNLTVAGTQSCANWLTLSPPTDTNRQTMLRCVVSNTSQNVVMSAMPNGIYEVYLYVIQTWNATGSTLYNMQLEGAPIGSYTAGSVQGVWSKLGPYTVTITDGTLNVTSNGSTMRLSGLEVWDTDGASMMMMGGGGGGEALLGSAPELLEEVPQIALPFDDTPLGMGVYESDDARIQYAGNWFEFDAGVFYRRSTTANDRLRFSVSSATSTELVLYRLVAPGTGTMEVCFNGVCQTWSNEHPEPVYSAPLVLPLPAGITEVEIRVGVGGDVILDALEIRPATTLPPTVTSQPEATAETTALPEATAEATALPEATAEATLDITPAPTQPEATPAVTEPTLMPSATAVPPTTEATLEATAPVMEEILPAAPVEESLPAEATESARGERRNTPVVQQRLLQSPDNNPPQPLPATSETLIVATALDDLAALMAARAAIVTKIEAAEATEEPAVVRTAPVPLDLVTVTDELPLDQTARAAALNALIEQAARLPEDAPIEALAVDGLAVDGLTVEGAALDGELALAPDGGEMGMMSLLSGDPSELFGTRCINYTYDGLQRLTSADYKQDASYTPGSLCTGGTSEIDYDYAYDRMGNRTWQNVTQGGVGTPTTYTYNEANQLISSLTTGQALQTYSYDFNGSRTGVFANGVKTVGYAYDANVRLKELTTYAVDGTTPVDTYAYLYNGDGDRVAQSINTISTEYLLDPTSGLTQVLGEFGPASTTYSLLGLDVIGQKTGADWTYFGYDGLGSVRQMYSNIATIGYAANYDPYGNLLVQDGFGSSLGFTGEQTDLSGLQYLRARYMDTTTGTFLTKDPVMGVVGGASIRWNGYGYAGGNPVNYVDPDGQFFWFAVGALLAGAFVAGVGFVGGAVLSGGLDLVGQLIENGGRFDCIDQERLGMAMLEGGIAGAIVGGLSFMAGVGTAAIGFGKAVQGLVKFGVEVAWDMSQGATLEEAVGYNLLFNGIGKIIGLAAKKGANLVGTIWQATGGDAIVRAGMKAMRGLVKGVDNAVRNSRAGQSLGDALQTLPNGLNPWDDVDELMRRDKLFDPLNQCKNSFSADTLVATEDGAVPISEIEIGDEVLAYNEATGEVGEYTVTDTISHIDPEIVLLTIDGEYLETTREHPFYTDESEWVNAGELTVGENIRSLDGDYGIVESVEVITVSQAMYNLTVDTAHTFFVGEGEWLVHNSSCIDAKAELQKLPEEDLDRVLARVNVYDKKGRLIQSPTLDQVNLQVQEVRAGDLENVIGSRRHGLYQEQLESIQQLSNEEIIGFNPSDPMSARLASDGKFELTGGHHRTHTIIERVKSGQLSPDTIVPILIHG